MTGNKARLGAGVRTFALIALMAGLAACNSSDPSSLGLQPDGTTPQTAPAVPAATAIAVINIAPIIGSTVEAVTPLSREIGSAARNAGIRIGADTDPALTHILKGYFSALAEPAGTTVIYVWDVFDTGGTRLHRIQGQEVQPGPGNPAEPWAGVTPAVMEKIARDTITAFTAWRQGSTNVASPAPTPQDG